MTSINGYQGPEPISRYGSACTDSDKLSILQVDTRGYQIDPDVDKIVREHCRGDVVARFCTALGNRFSEVRVKSDTSQLTRAQFDAPTDLQKQLQASSSPARTR